MRPIASTSYLPCFNAQGPLQVPVPTDRAVRELGERASVMMGVHFRASFPEYNPIMKTNSLSRYDVWDEDGYFSTGLRAGDQAMRFARFQRNMRDVSVSQLSSLPSLDVPGLVSRYQVRIPSALSLYLSGNRFLVGHPSIRVTSQGGCLSFEYQIRHGLEDADPDFVRFFDAARALIEYNSAG